MHRFTPRHVNPADEPLLDRMEDALVVVGFVLAACCLGIYVWAGTWA